MRSDVIGAIDRYSRNHKLNAVLAEAISAHNIANIPEFLGQVFVESQCLSNLDESLNYSVEALLRKYYPRRITKIQAQTFGRAPGQAANQQAIANAIYGGEFGLHRLGNTQPNDGWHFRGQGPIQQTGRYNITRFAEWMKDKNIVLDPTLISRVPEIAAASACWFWVQNSNCNRLGNNVPAITKEITGSAQTEIVRRTDMTDRFRRLIRAAVAA
jgi:putative chitinase